MPGSDNEPNPLQSSSSSSNTTPTASVVCPSNPQPVPGSLVLTDVDLLTDLPLTASGLKPPRLETSPSQNKSRQSLPALNTSSLGVPAGSQPGGTQKGKARASLPKQTLNLTATTPPSLPKPSRIRRETNMTSEAGSERSDIPALAASRPTSLTNQAESLATSPVVATSYLGSSIPNSALPPQSHSIAARLTIDDAEDDAVEPIDRGEALVRRRMKERQRLKKEAERRQRRVEDETSRPRPSHSRPTASRTRTAPAHPHRSHVVQGPLTADPANHTNELLNPTLAHVSRENPISRSEGVARSVSHYDTTLASSRVDNLLDPEASRDVSGPMATGSPERAQSTYQSFGSPSQFTSASVKSSDLGVLSASPSATNHLARARLAKSSRSSLASTGQCASAKPPATLQSDPEVESDDDDDYENRDEVYETLDIQTPTARGRSRVPPAHSIRSPVAAHQNTLLIDSPSRSKSVGRHASVHLAEPSVDEEIESGEQDSEASPSIAEAAELSGDASSELNDEDVEYTLKDRQDVNLPLDRITY